MSKAAVISSRRSFLAGLGAALITAPAIVRAGSLMPVKQMIEPAVATFPPPGWDGHVYCFQKRMWVTVSGRDLYRVSLSWQDGSTWTPKT